MSKPSMIMLGEVVESMKNGLYKPASAYADSGVACLRMYNIDQGKIVWRDIKRMLLTQQDLNDYRLLPGDLLVNRVNSRELVGKSAVIPQWQEPVVFESKNIRVRLNLNKALPKFVNYQLLLEGRRYFSNNAQQVVGMASINQKQLSDFPILLPSLPVQEQVVAEIEKQFSRLDETVAGLKRIQANLKRYKAAVLKAAVEGKLTEQWRKEHPDVEPADQLLKRILAERRAKWQAEELAKMIAKGIKPKDDSWKKKYKDPVGPDTVNLPKLPEGWVWTSLEQLLYQLRNGISAKPDAQTGLQILRISAVRPMQVNLEDARFLASSEGEYAEFVLSSEDLLFTRYNGNPDYVGVCGVVPAELPRAIVYPDKLIRCKLASFEAVPSFVAEMANVGPSRAYLAARVRTTAGQAGISGGDLRGMPVPLPSRTEQLAIIAEIERRLSITEKLETAIDSNLKRAECLRQRILNKAFTPLTSI